jgi:hypothetical protein
MNRRWLFVAAAPLLLGGAGPCSETMSGEGVIHQGVGPECAQTWNITTSDGRVLWPVENPEFQQEGLRVRFKVRERKGTATICMAGTTVDVISLRKL